MEVEVCASCTGPEHNHASSSLDMGTKIGPRRLLVWQKRSGRRINTGMIDLDTGLYAWAPGDGQSVANMVWDGYMSFGVDEWNTLLQHGVRRLEFKDPSTRLIYVTGMKRAIRYAREDGTKYGQRVLVPLGVFKVIHNDSGELIKGRHRRYACKA